MLLLDSDNKIQHAYIDRGISALQQNQNAAVAYAQPNFFGINKKEFPFTTGPFKIERLLIENFIDMCAVVRKQAWQSIGGLDKKLIWYEDWEFWLQLYKAGWEFIYLNEVLFHYRIRPESLMQQTNEESYKKIISYLYKKHWDLVFKIFYKLYAKEMMYEMDIQKPLRSFLKYSRKKYL